MKEKQHKIEHLLEPDIAIDYITTHAPEFAQSHDLSDLKVIPIKDHIGEKKYHIVVQYSATSLGDNPIFLTAHSEENRNTACKALMYIQEHGFTGKDIFLPNALFFDSKYKAFVYQGMDGKNLLHYISKPNHDLKEHLVQAAHWIAELHQTPIQKAKNFNPENSRIKTTLPGPKYFLPKIKTTYPDMYDGIKSAFEDLVNLEKKTLATMDKKYLIHGDFHPENVIINNTDKKASVIDFTDVCLADYTRDVGSLIQQLEYMSQGKRSEKEIEKNREIFLDAYFEKSKTHEIKDIEQRINMYSSWTALRSTIYFLTKGDPEKGNAKIMLKTAQHYLTLI